MLNHNTYHIPQPKDLPFLQAICWQQNGVQNFTQDEILNRYERGWNYRGVLEDIKGEELHFLRELATKRGSWLATDV